MSDILSCDWPALLNSVLYLTTAFVLGSLIGFERQFRQRTAGLQTNVLVAVGAAAFVHVASNLYGDEGAIRVGANIITGIGFLGAGIIMREGGLIVGLNTAATLWCSAAVGFCAGCGRIQEAALATICILSANTLLRPLVTMINKRPIALSTLEGVCTIFIIGDYKHGKETMALIREELHKRHYNLRRLDLLPFGGEAMKIEAVIDTSVADTHELDQLTETLCASPTILQAFWSRGANG
jgi:putative Mg2+ transporter-C (MgtC) family protein